MLIDYKAIGDTLTIEELNAYASLIANNKVLKDSFKLKNGVVNGVYGNYEFDLSNASIVDNGILITDETLSNNITVKLSNATQYATYTLHFTVVRYGDVNILDETTENIETFDLTVDLIRDTNVNIPLTDLQEYDVILFQSNITIQHNKPEIIGKYITDLQLTADKPIIQTSETSILEITATDLEHLPVGNKSIQLLKNNTLLDTLTTDSQGKATYTYTGIGDGLLNFIAKYRSLQSETYSLIDALFYDDALTNAKWNTNYADVTVNREIVSTGTRLYYSADSGTKYCNTVIGGTRNWFDSTKSYQIDFDFSYERDSSSSVGIGVGSNGYNIHNHFSGALTGSGHYKIIVTNNTYQFYLDDVIKGSPISITGNNGLFFSIYRTGSITFKNLQIIEI